MYVIFICDFDLFGENQYKYTFTNKCDEVDGLSLDEGKTTIFMNTEGQSGNISEDCKLFLKAVKCQFTDAPFSAILKSEVERIKLSAEWRTEYMRLSEWLEDEKEMATEAARAEGLEQGIEQGLEQGQLKTIISLVCKKMKKNLTYEEIADQLEENIDKIAGIGEIAKQVMPKYDVDKILEELNK